MEGASPNIRAAPSALLLALPAAVLSTVAAIAWVLLALEAFFAAPWDPQWLFCGLALPSATIGSVATYTTRRWWPFFLGLAITLIPLVLFAILPGPPPMAD
ncbi:MAG TPA: hypothetical protein VG518_02175 [Solirubrobacterales bacterium]|nr:hypothetical protein [Solirubrobacterales bacterium]